jgi:hypothetical protein
VKVLELRSSSFYVDNINFQNMKLQISNNNAPKNGYYDNMISWSIEHGVQQVKLFAVNGFELCPLEKLYQQANQDHSDYIDANKLDWITQTPEIENIVLSHSFVLWRKGYTAAAADQLGQWVKHWPIYHRVLQIKPKWGLDFAIESISVNGTIFEILHFEHDFFEYQQFLEMKLSYQDLFVNADWADMAQQVYRHRSQWQHLDFFPQSRWKCEFFGVVPEKFGNTIWHLL